MLLQVYYLYRLPIHAQSTLPTWVGAFRLLRLICLRERITLVHCHQAFSTLGGEALLQARTMGYKVSITMTLDAAVQHMCLGRAY
jgi:phosphatidylinositol glycan class A protein